MAWRSNYLILSGLVFFVVTVSNFGWLGGLSNRAVALPTEQSAPKIKFQKRTLQIESLKITVEIADSDEKQEQGLMFRKTLSPNQGMLFIFPDEQPRAFWMKNTFVDLDIGFFDKNKKLIDIQTMGAMKSVMDTNLPSYSSAAPAEYALEVPKSWFSKNKIKLGSTFELH